VPLDVVPIFVFEPHKGFGPVALGSSRDDTRQAMANAGFPLERSRKRIDYFCGSSIQVESDDNDLVRFIGVSGSPRFDAKYRDVSVFGVGAEQLFRLIAGADASGEHQYSAAEYRFPGQIMTLWQADPQYDYMGNESRAVWAQVGLGNADYAAVIARMTGKF